MNKQTKSVLACAIGNTLEWFDYTLYGLFATTLSRLFFPADSNSSLLLTYLVFAFGFFSRPLGGIVLGYIGDVFGRRLALIISILTMSIPTFLTGLLPTYESIGVLAPISLAVIRLFQGIAIGGDFSGSMVYLVERAPPKKRGFFGSWSDFGSPLGVLLGLFVSSLLTTFMDPANFELYGWRIPFLLGVVIAAFGVYLRYEMEETESFFCQCVVENCENRMPIKSSDRTRAKNSNSIIVTIKKHAKTIGYAVSINAYGGVVFYMLLTYLHNYFKVAEIATQQQAFLFTTLVNLCMTIFIPLGGMLSDKFGRKIVMMSSIGATMLCIFPMFTTLNSYNLCLHMLFEIAIGGCLGIFFGGRAAFYAEAFPTHIRCTAIALSFGISHSVFAGTTPLVAEIIMKNTGSCYYLGAFMFAFAMFALYSMHQLEDRTAQKLL
ncbi:MAG: MFS transporter [Holosporaceae bacterium]|jgi:MHS family proline/betaine transporter-like MFS transporter|nr:MFS transporter [Holosporaceae bacterium]